MSAAEDRFIAGDGPLAALIRAQPAFEAPPRLLEHILTALEATPAPAGFEAPAGLFDAVMVEAERIDGAQAPRREALLAELAAGKKASDALGAEVSPATAAWLAAQQPTADAAPRVRRRRWPWLAGISTALTAALAVSVALRMVQEPAMPPPMPAQTSMSAPAESRAEASADVAAEPAANATGSAKDTIAFAPKPQVAERLGKAEAAPAKIARTRPSESREREAKRTAPQATPPAKIMADAAPASPVVTAPPAAAAPTMAKALRSAPAKRAPLRADADEAIAPPSTISAALDTAPAELATRLLALPAGAWALTVSAADEAVGDALRTALVAELKRLGREDIVIMNVGAVAPGQLRITPVE
ncbi:hypothetical protein O4G98_15145 [Zoogloeaceae bacterium G21618-S1]|nr:hypothetical protein [Zoogloeaceae bacterium G21618-S1]